MFKYRLAEPFEVLTGIQVLEHDGLPNFICSYCSSLLVKSVSFREKCCNTQEFLKYSMLEQRVLSLDYLQSVSKQLNVSLSYNTLTNVITMEDSLDNEQIKVEEITDTDEKTVKDEVILELPNRVDRKTDEVALMDYEELTVKIEPKDIEQDYDSCDFPPAADSDHEKNEELDDVEVIILSKDQQKEEIEARKTSFNYLNSFHKCDQCYKGFIYDSTFKNHMMRHDPECGPFVCDICLVRWPEARLLRAHVAASHERKYLCKMCGHVSRSSHRAREHRKWHTGFRFSCKLCSASFTKSTSYLTHLRLHHPSDNACEVCGESFIGEYGLRMHMRRAHKNAQPDKVMEAMQCESCSVQFLKLEALRRHQEEAKGGVCDPVTKPCSHCGEGLLSEEALKEHAACHQEDERVTCKDCSRTFASSRSHAIHQQRVHLGVRLKQARPARRPRLKGGAKRPSSETVVCEFCGKKSMTKAALRYHQRIHTGEKPFQCNQCPKRFSVCQRLQIHMRTHTGECPYKCSHCPKAFKHKAALNRHDRVHTGEKPYVCPQCGKAFSQSNSMKMHVNTVHLKMPSPYRSRKTKT